MSSLDIIKYDGPIDGSPWLVHKFPGNDFLLGSRLTVNEGQEALFYKGGKALDLFGAGAYTLATKNLPLLERLVNIPFGGKTPFSAEVYFVNKTTRLDMKWGTATPFELEDPKYGLILKIRSFGKYGIKVVDSRKLVTELVGALNGGTTVNYPFISSYFSGLITTSIKSVIASFMIGRRISFLEVTAFLKELSNECLAQLKEEFAKYGVDIVNFYIESINPPKEDYEKLRSYKEDLALGNDFYKQRRSFDVMEAMAKNQGGGAANAGIGLGMGMGMAPMLNKMFSGMGENVNGGMTGGNTPNVGGQSAPANNQQGAVCPRCGANNPSGQKFCGECGEVMVTGIVCPVCGKINESGMRFCGECGTKLAKICPTCGKEHDPSQKFCGECGTKL